MEVDGAWTRCIVLVGYMCISERRPQKAIIEP